MSESGPVSGEAERSRRPDVRRSFEAAAVGDVAACRLDGVVRLLDDLAREVRLTAEDYRYYFMAWQVTRILRPRPGDAAGQVAPAPR